MAEMTVWIPQTATTDPWGAAILMETSGTLLLEDGSRILLETSAGTGADPWTKQTSSSTPWTPQ